MSRVRTEIEIDQELLRWVDEQAARSGRSRAEVLEEVIRRRRPTGRSLVEIASEVWERSDLTGQQAMVLARAETKAVRTQRPLSDLVAADQRRAAGRRHSRTEKAMSEHPEGPGRRRAPPAAEGGEAELVRIDLGVERDRG